MSLIKTNPYLKNKKMREYLFEVTARSSSAVEGIKIPKKIKVKEVKNDRP